MLLLNLLFWKKLQPLLWERKSPSKSDGSGSGRRVALKRAKLVEAIVPSTVGSKVMLAVSTLMALMSHCL